MFVWFGLHIQTYAITKDEETKLKQPVAHIAIFSQLVLARVLNLCLFSHFLPNVPRRSCNARKRLKNLHGVYKKV